MPFHWTNWCKSYNTYFFSYPLFLLNLILLRGLHSQSFWYIFMIWNLREFIFSCYKDRNLLLLCFFLTIKARSVKTKRNKQESSVVCVKGRGNSKAEGLRYSVLHLQCEDPTASSLPWKMPSSWRLLFGSGLPPALFWSVSVLYLTSQDAYYQHNW